MKTFVLLYLLTLQNGQTIEGIGESVRTTDAVCMKIARDKQVRLRKEKHGAHALFKNVSVRCIAH